MIKTQLFCSYDEDTFNEKCEALLNDDWEMIGFGVSEDNECNILHSSIFKKEIDENAD